MKISGETNTNAVCDDESSQFAVVRTFICVIRYRRWFRYSSRFFNAFRYIVVITDRTYTFISSELFVPRVRPTLSCDTSLCSYFTWLKANVARFLSRSDFTQFPHISYIYLSPLSSRVSLWRNGALFQRRPTKGPLPRTILPQSAILIQTAVNKTGGLVEHSEVMRLFER